MTPCQVTFRASQFESRVPKPHFINERCFGEDAAAWLRAGLAALHPCQAIVQEDFGWGFSTSDRRCWISVGVMDESIGQDVAEWLVSVECGGRTLLDRLLGRGDAGHTRSVCRAIDQVLRSDPAIEDVRWWREVHEAPPRDHP